MLKETDIEHLPTIPGVYVFKQGKTVLYVGKAKNIKNRVITHKLNNTLFYQKSDKVEYIITSSESEALLLEANLIKQYSPKYNIRLTDDKKYPYIAITKNEPFPRIFLTRNLMMKNADIFGPFMSASAIRKALKMLREIFPVRNCKYKLPSRRPIKPCIEYYMGLCNAPCVPGKISEDTYKSNVNNIKRVILGKFEPVIKYLSGEMEKAASDLNFEYAKLIRDRIASLHELKHHFYISSLKKGAIDIIGGYHLRNQSYFFVMFYRDGKVLNTAYYRIEKGYKYSDTETLFAFITQFYTSLSQRPEKVMVPIFPMHKTELERTFEFKIEIPKNEFKKLLKLADKNAEEIALHEERKKKRIHPAMVELKEVFNLDITPKRIECVDASQLFGSFRVASLVVMENGRLKKSDYRRYKITNSTGKDDFAMIYEVTLRRFKRALKDKKDMPDIYVLDGGLMQLKAALKAKFELGLKEVYFIAFAKRFDDFYLEDGRRVMLPKRSFSLKLMKLLRDEAHRFAITYHRKLRNNNSFRDFLDFMPNIGEKRKKALIEYFGSLKKIKMASAEDIMQIPGFGRKLANRLYNLLHED